MYDLLTEAIEPSILAEESNFKLIPLYNTSLLQRDFLIETTHKLFETTVAQFLGLDEMVLQESAITCVIQGQCILGRCNCIKFITYEQMMELLANTHNPRADKFKPLLSQAILTQVLPLFNPLPKKEIDLNLTTINQQLTMSSQEIADLVELRHDNVKRTIETLVTKGIIVQPQIEDEQFADKLGRIRTQKVYMIGKRDSYVVVAQLSPEFTARLVDRWQELEEGLQSGKNNIQLVVPQSLPEALRLAASLAEEKQQLQHERDEAIRTKSQIGSKREATAMSTAGILAMENKRLKIQLGQSQDFATIKAVERFVKQSFNWHKLKKYCASQNLKCIQVNDPLYGKVNSYPAKAWREVYGIDIHSLVGRV